MTKQEFRERLFDVINESDEIFIEDIEFDPINGQLHVAVGDGSKFVIICKTETRNIADNTYENIISLFDPDSLHDTCKELSATYENDMNETNVLINNFYDTLPDTKQQFTFEKIMDETSFCQKTECEASFIEGFKMGMKLTMEALKV